MWKWFGFLRSDKLQVSVLCKMCRLAAGTGVRCALSAYTQMVAVYGVYLPTTTTVCVSELNMLLVYPACSKLKYYASEADCHMSARSLFPSVHTPLSLLLLCYASGWNELRFQLKHRYVASLILHASIAEITALLPLSYLILSDDGTIIN